MRIIAGKFKGSVLKAPKGIKTRPTPSRLRETVFNILQSNIDGATFLDLFAGSGLTGLEAVSRGAGSVTFVDSSYQCIQCMKSNAEKLGVSKEVQIIKSDVVACLERYAKQKKQFDIIYADPPYKEYVEYQGNTYLFSSLIIHLVDRHKLLKDGGILFVEEGHELEIDDTDLQHLFFKRTKNCGKATLHEFRG